LKILKALSLDASDDEKENQDDENQDDDKENYDSSDLLVAKDSKENITTTNEFDQVARTLVF